MRCPVATRSEVQPEVESKADAAPAMIVVASVHRRRSRKKVRQAPKTRFNLTTWTDTWAAGWSNIGEINDAGSSEKFLLDGFNRV